MTLIDKFEMNYLTNPISGSIIISVFAVTFYFLLKGVIEKLKINKKIIKERNKTADLVFYSILKFVLFLFVVCLVAIYQSASFMHMNTKFQLTGPFLFITIFLVIINVTLYYKNNKTLNKP